MSRTIGEQPKLLKESEVSSILNIAIATCRRWRWAGKGPNFVKIGGSVRYQPADIAAFIEDGRRASTADTGKEAV